MGAALAKTLAHFWPDLPLWLRQLGDSRDQDQITFPRQFLFWTAALTFLLKLGARRQLHYELDSPAALANLNRLAGCAMEKIAHGDTVEHFLSHLSTASLERLRRNMMRRLLRMKALDAGRLQGHTLVVIDGTGQFHFPARHCAYCLAQTVGGVTHYYHHVLEAKLVTPEGLALSLDSEFILNSDPGATKQDCELKAFIRLAARLKRQYPQLRLCLLLDALYANGTVLHLCAENHWRYLITFKRGSLPTLWEDFQSLCTLAEENRQSVRLAPDTVQDYAWVRDLEHVDNQKRRHRVNALQCREEGPDGLRFFAWLTNFPLWPDNVVELAQRGGRRRWKIENEGFNIQKNGGFNLEHAYSTKDRPMRNWYLLLQITHLILQLLERGSLLDRQAKSLFGSLANLARRLRESLRNVLIPPEALDGAAAARIQIRLNSS